MRYIIVKGEIKDSSYEVLKNFARKENILVVSSEIEFPAISNRFILEESIEENGESLSVQREPTNIMVVEGYKIGLMLEASGNEYPIKFNTLLQKKDKTFVPVESLVVGDIIWYDGNLKNITGIYITYSKERTSLDYFIGNPYISLLANSYADYPHYIDDDNITRSKGGDFKKSTSRKDSEGTPAAVRNSKEEPKIGRNDLCPCGSGIKYKKCHGK